MDIEKLPILLNNLERVYYSSYIDILRKNKLTIKQWEAIESLFKLKNRRNTSTEIAKSIDVFVPSLTRMVRILSRRGIIDKTVLESDARHNSLVLTAEGRALYRKLNPLIANRKRRFCQDAKKTDNKINGLFNALSDYLKV